jgi:hypothetical protein
MPFTCKWAGLKHSEGAIGLAAGIRGAILKRLLLWGRRNGFGGDTKCAANHHDHHKHDDQEENDNEKDSPEETGDWILVRVDRRRNAVHLLCLYARNNVHSL